MKLNQKKILIVPLLLLSFANAQAAKKSGQGLKCQITNFKATDFSAGFQPRSPIEAYVESVGLTGPVDVHFNAAGQYFPTEANISKLKLVCENRVRELEATDPPYEYGGCGYYNIGTLTWTNSNEGPNGPGLGTVDALSAAIYKRKRLSNDDVRALRCTRFTDIKMKTLIDGISCGDEWIGEEARVFSKVASILECN